jgi:hypothetical protein
MKMEEASDSRQQIADSRQKSADKTHIIKYQNRFLGAQSDVESQTNTKTEETSDEKRWSIP